MNKMQAYHYCEQNGAAFVVNVVLTRGGPDAAKRIKAVAAMLKAGHTVSFAPFSTDAVLLNGYTVTWDGLVNSSMVARIP